MVATRALDQIASPTSRPRVPTPTPSSVRPSLHDDQQPAVASYNTAQSLSSQRSIETAIDSEPRPNRSARMSKRGISAEEKASRAVAFFHETVRTSPLSLSALRALIGRVAGAEVLLHDEGTPKGPSFSRSLRSASVDFLSSTAQLLAKEKGIGRCLLVYVLVKLCVC